MTLIIQILKYFHLTTHLKNLLIRPNLHPERYLSCVFNTEKPLIIIPLRHEILKVQLSWCISTKTRHENKSPCGLLAFENSRKKKLSSSPKMSPMHGCTKENQSADEKESSQEKVVIRRDSVKPRQRLIFSILEITATRLLVSRLYGEVNFLSPPNELHTSV